VDRSRVPQPHKLPIAVATVEHRVRALSGHKLGSLAVLAD